MELERVKTLLCDALRDRAPQYWDLLKSWYKQKITKDEFDKKAKDLLGETGIQLHNDFLFSILIKCHTLSHNDVTVQSSVLTKGTSNIQHGSERGSKRAKLDPTPSRNITPFGVFNESRYQQPPQATMCGKDLDRILLCSHELLLPDLPTLHTRMLLLAWECGLDGATEDTALYMSRALETFLKSVLAACITSKTDWKLKSNKYQHGFGKGYNPALSSISIDRLQSQENRTLALEALEAEHIAKTPKRTHSEPLNCFDLRDTLSTYGNTCIPSYSVRALVMERVLGSMWHPSANDLSNIDSITKWKQSLMKL